jgi:hypothetical protein
MVPRDSRRRRQTIQKMWKGRVSSVWKPAQVATRHSPCSKTKELLWASTPTCSKARVTLFHRKRNKRSPTYWILAIWPKGFLETSSMIKHEAPTPIREGGTFQGNSLTSIAGSAHWGWSSPARGYRSWYGMNVYPGFPDKAFLARSELHLLP